MEPKRTNSKLISLGVFIAVVALVVAIAMVNKKDKTDADAAVATTQTEGATTSADSTTGTTSPTDATATTPATTTPAATDVSASAYKAGTYTAEGSYQDPDSQETIKITLTLAADGTITDTSAVNQAQNRDSSEYQDIFISNYKSSVVGKKISTLKLGNISGSSLTPIGFNNAAAAIAQQAINS